MTWEETRPGSLEETAVRTYESVGHSDDTRRDAEIGLILEALRTVAKTATERAANIALEAAKRYTCRQRIALCLAIRDAVLREDK
jgi:hypothetical protein